MTGAVRDRLLATLEEAERAQREAGVEWPEIPEELVKHLEATYPPRTMGRLETVEDHLRYAGAVELVQNIRHHHEQQREMAMSAEPGAAVEIFAEES